MATVQSFEPIAHALRAAVIEHFEVSGRDLDDVTGRRTVDTNSSLAEVRADILAHAFLSRSGHSTLEGVQVADLGCGFGSLALVLASRGASVTAVDPNEPRLRVGEAVGRSFGLDARFGVGTMQDPGLDTEAFDLAVINNAFCYLTRRPDRRIALRSVHEVLRPGGWVVMRDPNRLHPFDPFTGLPVVHQLPLPLGRATVRALRRHRSDVRLESPGAAMRNLRRARFEDCRFDGTGSPRSVLDRLARYHHVSARKPLTG